MSDGLTITANLSNSTTPKYPIPDIDDNPTTDDNNNDQENNEETN